MKVLWILLHLFLLTSCDLDEEGITDTVTSESTTTSSIAELKIAGNVSLNNRTDSDSVEPLRRFFAQKLQADGAQDFWLLADMERYKHPFAPLRYIEYDSEGELKYEPTLMRIQEIDEANNRMLTVRWAAMDSTGTAADVWYVFKFLSLETEQGYRLALPTEHLTMDWQREQVGNIQYIISPEHKFDERIAREQLQSIAWLSEFFDIAPFPITYYSCQGPSDLFKAQGFEYHPLMYVHETGGMVDHGEHVWSGNDLDSYTHEIVHIYTGRKFEERQALLDEGLATIIGGSSEHSYAFHREVLTEYLSHEPEFNFSEHLLTTKQEYIDELTSIPYMVGGLICEYVYNKGGKKKLFEVMSSGEDPWPQLNELGLSKNTMNEKLRSLLGKPYEPLFL